MFWDPTMLLIIPALILAFYAQNLVSGTYAKFSKIRNSLFMTGREAARKILDHHGLHDVEIVSIQGHLSDHYDPRKKVVGLSVENYSGTSVAALCIAAHEVGHAIQHAKGYHPLVIRNSILPVASFGSGAAFPLFLVGMFLSLPFLMDIGIIFFAAAFLFQLVTLPVEFNASSRAMNNLKEVLAIKNDEIVMGKKVLNAAALTYVASALMALLQLVRLLLIRGNRD